MWHIAAIHDCIGSHAADVDKVAVMIREAFVEMYSQDVMGRFFEDIKPLTNGKKLPEIPVKGTLDIEQVMDSPYFFG